MIVWCMYDLCTIYVWFMYDLCTISAGPRITFGMSFGSSFAILLDFCMIYVRLVFGLCLICGWCIRCVYGFCSICIGFAFDLPTICAWFNCVRCKPGAIKSSTTQQRHRIPNAKCTHTQHVMRWWMCVRCHVMLWASWVLHVPWDLGSRWLALLDLLWSGRQTIAITAMLFWNGRGKATALQRWLRTIHGSVRSQHIWDFVLFVGSRPTTRTKRSSPNLEICSGRWLETYDQNTTWVTHTWTCLNVLWSLVFRYHVCFTTNGHNTFPHSPMSM